jgi:hypothetical protein
MTALNKKIQPLIREAMMEGKRRWADHLQDILDFAWGRKRSDSSVAFDQFLARVPVLRYYVKPFALDRWLGAVKTLQYWRHLQTGRFYIINRFQPFQTLWPVVGTEGMWRGLKLMHSEEGKALVAKYDITGVAGRFKEGQRLPANWQRFTPAGASEAKNQAWAFLCLYDHARSAGMAEPQAARYARLRGQVFTQFAYSQADVPKFMRGPIGGTIFQYKRFTIKQLELLEALIRERNFTGVGRWVAAQLAIGGAKALLSPLKALGIGGLSFALYQALKKDVGEDVANAVVYGAPSLAGVDLSGSIEIINPPKGGTVQEKIGGVVLGPTGQTLVDIYTAAAETNLARPMGSTERIGRKLLQGSPSVQQIVYLAKALSRDTTDLDPRGREQYKRDLGDLWRKAFGFRTINESRQSAQVEALFRMKEEYDHALDGIATAILAGDESEAERRVNLWNATWPEFPITEDLAAERVKARQKQQTGNAAERMAGTLPKPIRGYAEEVGVEAPGSSTPVKSRDSPGLTRSERPARAGAERPKR